jgi:hypothetical protein
VSRAIAATAAAIVLLAGIASGQVPRGEGTAAGCPLLPVQFYKCALAKAKTFNPPRTPDGQPDMRGMWSRTVASQDVEEHTAAYGRNAGPTLVVDTPDGKIPYQPWALELRDKMVDQYISPLANCAPPGIPRQIFTPGGSQIVQAPGYFIFMNEYSHTFRIVPVTSRPALPGNVKLWMGDSRGRWEGNTLVVEVTNTNGLTWLDNAGNFYSDGLRVTERFTLVDADTIHYEARLEDPVVYTRPWTIAVGLTRNKEASYEFLEEACHEGNEYSRTGQLNVGLKLYPGITRTR